METLHTISLDIRAFLFRQLCRFGFYICNRRAGVVPPVHSIYIDSTLPKLYAAERAIKLDIWLAPPTASKEAAESAVRPCVISIHGGGFVIGEGTDDSLWINAVGQATGAVAVAVNYRLAPNYPFPTAVEDCADAILYIYSHAESLGIDRNKIILSGFSAGGNLVFSSFYLLRQLQAETSIGFNENAIRGIVAFYPVLDWSMSRQMKKERSVRPESVMPAWMTNIFDKSYVPTGTDRASHLLSPGLASDQSLEALPDVHLCVCEWDMLLQEAIDFKDRLSTLRRDKEVGFSLVKGVWHGFDKPTPKKPRPVVKEEYGKAIAAIERWLCSEDQLMS